MCVCTRGRQKEQHSRVLRELRFQGLCKNRRTKQIETKQKNVNNSVNYEIWKRINKQTDRQNVWTV